MTKDECKAALLKASTCDPDAPLMSMWHWNYYLVVAFEATEDPPSPFSVPFWRWWRVGVAKPKTTAQVGAIPLNIDQYLYLIPAKVYRHATLPKIATPQ